MIVRIITYKERHELTPSILGWMYVRQRSRGRCGFLWKLVMESIRETKTATILQFIHGLRGDLQVTFEKGTCAAWLHDLLKPQSDKC